MKRLLFVGLVVVSLVVGLTRLKSKTTEEIRLAGVVSANEAIVSSEIPGRLLQLLVTEGDPVRKGQVVAVLVADELEAQRANKRALIEQFTAKVQQGEEQVRLERGRVASQIDSAMAQVKALESQRAENVAELEQSRNELERTRQLVREGLVARQHEERHETTVEVAEARLRALEDRVEAARAEVEVYRAGERQIRVAEREVQQTKAQRDQAEADLEQIEVRLGHTELKSPLTGIVSVRAAREGEFVAAGTPVVTVVDVNDTWVRAQVEETFISSLIVGQQLKVRLASDEEILGKVTFISPEAEFATQRDVDRVKRDIRTFGVKVALPNPEGRVHPGMTAFVLLPYDGEAPPSVARPSFETTRSPDLVPEASAASAPISTVKPPSTRSEAQNPDPSRLAELESVLPELIDSEEHASETEDPERLPPSRPRDPADPMPEREGSSDRLSRDSLAFEDLMGRIQSGGATDADMALLEEHLAAELGREKVPLLERAVETTPVRTPTLGGSTSSRPCADERDCQSVTPEFQLEAISFIDGKPAAIINGARVFEGQTIGEAKVVRILESSVQLEYRGRPITLRF